MNPSTVNPDMSARKPIEVMATPPQAEIKLRREARPSDVQAVRAIAASTDFFAPDEVEVAIELIEDRVEQGATSEYHFVFADVAGAPVGFASFGPIACTVGSYDLYWIAVRRDHSGGGLGRKLMEEVEREIAEAGGRRIYVETSSREQYAPTRRFYERCGYAIDAVQNDFYAPGDGKVTLVKALTSK